jgi:hypothetical protein
MDTYQHLSGGATKLGDQCSVCFEPVTRANCARPQDCRHIFHRECIEQARRANPHCPECRRPITAIVHCNFSPSARPVPLKRTSRTGKRTSRHASRSRPFKKSAKRLSRPASRGRSSKKSASKKRVRCAGVRKTPCNKSRSCRYISANAKKGIKRGGCTRK